MPAMMVAAPSSSGARLGRRRHPLTLTLTLSVASPLTLALTLAFGLQVRLQAQAGCAQLVTGYLRTKKKKKTFRFGTL